MSLCIYCEYQDYHGYPDYHGIQGCSWSITGYVCCIRYSTLFGMRGSACIVDNAAEVTIHYLLPRHFWFILHYLSFVVYRVLLAMCRPSFTIYQLTAIIRQLSCMISGLYLNDHFNVPLISYHK